MECANTKGARGIYCHCVMHDNIFQQCGVLKQEKFLALHMLIILAAVRVSHNRISRYCGSFSRQ